MVKQYSHAIIKCETGNIKKSKDAISPKMN